MSSHEYTTLIYLLASLKSVSIEFLIKLRLYPPEWFLPSSRLGLFFFLLTMVAVLATLARVTSDENTLIISEKFSEEIYGFTLVGNVGILVTDNWPLLCF